MNLTFFGTLGVALVMFFGLFVALVITLLLAGLGRLLAIAVAALARGLKSAGEPAGQTIAVEPRADAASTAKAARPAKPAKPARKEPQLSPEWAAAVERADARARARAKAEAAPEVKVSVRELPSPKAPARDITEVGPLVESAMDRNGVPAAPRAVKKPPVPATSPVLDTGSLAMLKHQPAGPGQRQGTGQGQQQNTERKAS
nr:hypothetical protein [Arthrobacter sp. C9C5]